MIFMDDTEYSLEQSLHPAVRLYMRGDLSDSIYLFKRTCSTILIESSLAALEARKLYYLRCKVLGRLFSEIYLHLCYVLSLRCIC